MNELLSNQESSLYKEWFDQFIEVEEQINEKRKISNDLLQGMDDPNQVSFFFWIELNLVESLRKMNKEFVAVNTKAFVSNNSMNTYLFNVDKKDT